MQPPYPDELPDVAVSGTTPAPSRPRSPRLVGSKAGSNWLFLALMNGLSAACFACAMIEPVAYKAQNLIGAGTVLLGIAVLGFVASLFIDGTEQRMERERAAAEGIPDEEVWRTFRAEAARLEGIGERLMTRYRTHSDANRIYEATFWMRVFRVAHRVLVGREPSWVTGEHQRSSARRN